MSGDGGDFLTRPGDDFCQRGEIRPILESHGWQFLGSKPDGNELWRRPGKESGGHSATFDGNVFYVFSSNAAPFESERGYSRFQVYATLECGGDYTRAARELLGKGYGQSLPEKPVDFSGLSATVGGQGRTDANVPAILPLGELVERYPKMKPVLIHGFLRRGETMNIIAPPKTGKSWLVTDLALSVATGTPWFGFPCEKGKVLIIDNELHPETSANRIPKVVAARGIDIKKVRNDIYVENQRDVGHGQPSTHRQAVVEPFGAVLRRGLRESEGVLFLVDSGLVEKVVQRVEVACHHILFAQTRLLANEEVLVVGNRQGQLVVLRVPCHLA